MWVKVQILHSAPKIVITHYTILFQHRLLFFPTIHFTRTTSDDVSRRSLHFFLDLFFSLYFPLCYRYNFDAAQGNTVENGTLEKNRLVISVRDTSHISINFGSIPRYTMGQYSLTKSKAARSESGHLYKNIIV